MVSDSAWFAYVGREYLEYEPEGMEDIEVEYFEEYEDEEYEYHYGEENDCNA